MSNNNLKIRLSVDSFYDSISKKKQKTKIDPKRLSKSLGYDEKIINEFPDEINKKFDNIEFIKGELIDIPLEDKSVDRVISNCVINLEPDKQKVYDEIYRILKDDGMFVISDILLKQELPTEWKNSEKLYCT